MKLLPLLILLGFMMQASLAKQPEPGAKAIDFSLRSYQGDVVKLSDLQGKVVLLDFWASWCAPCREELPYLDVLRKTYGEKGLVVVAVNIDNRPQNAVAFLNKYSIKLDPLWDKRKKVIAAYDVSTMPTTFLIDKTGIIRFVHSGFEAEQYQAYKQQIELLLKQGRSERRTTRSSSSKKGS